MYGDDNYQKCICPRFKDTGGYRIADLCCPIHGISGTNPGDGYWDDESPSGGMADAGDLNSPGE